MVSPRLDINGDGIDDAVIGQAESDALHIIFGDKDIGGAMLDLSTPTLSGKSSTYFGSDVSSAGDINGDGV